MRIFIREVKLIMTFEITMILCAIDAIAWLLCCIITQTCTLLVNWQKLSLLCVNILLGYAISCLVVYRILRQNEEK